MTDSQRTLLYFDHCRRAGDFLVDKLLCIRSFANRAKQRGNQFVYQQEPSS